MHEASIYFKNHVTRTYTVVGLSALYQTCGEHSTYTLQGFSDVVTKPGMWYACSNPHRSLFHAEQPMSSLQDLLPHLFCILLHYEPFYACPYQPSGLRTHKGASPHSQNCNIPEGVLLLSDSADRRLYNQDIDYQCESNYSSCFMQFFNLEEIPFTRAMMNINHHAIILTQGY